MAIQVYDLSWRYLTKGPSVKSDLVDFARCHEDGIKVPRRWWDDLHVPPSHAQILIGDENRFSRWIHVHYLDVAWYDGKRYFH